MRRINRPWLISLAVGAFMLALEIWFKLGNAMIVAVTAVYAGLVFFQLKEMKEQRLQQIAIRDEDRKEAEERKPRLKILPPLRRYQPQSRDKSGGQIGFGFYLNLNLLNTGRLLAKNCEPYLRQVWMRNGAGQWTELGTWIVPIPLQWGFDEHAIRTTGAFTESKDVIPNRPYLFNLLRCDIGSPDNLLLLVQRSPVDQPVRLPPGEYRMDVTVYSENALPVTRRYVVFWCGGMQPSMEETDFNRLLRIEEEAASQHFDSYGDSYQNVPQ